MLKEPYKSKYKLNVDLEKLSQLTSISRALDDVLNRVPLKQSAYVGASAFAHKAGLHASAILKSPETYEHVSPDLVGNQRVIPMSNQAGQSNLRMRLNEANLSVEKNDPNLLQILDEIKRREDQGYAYDSAQASFELLARQHLGRMPKFFEVKRYKVTVERRKNKYNKICLLYTSPSPRD